MSPRQPATHRRNSSKDCSKSLGVTGGDFPPHQDWNSGTPNTFLLPWVQRRYKDCFWTCGLSQLWGFRHQFCQPDPASFQGRNQQRLLLIWVVSYHVFPQHLQATEAAGRLFLFLSSRNCKTTVLLIGKIRINCSHSESAINSYIIWMADTRAIPTLGNPVLCAHLYAKQTSEILQGMPCNCSCTLFDTLSVLP